MNKYTYTVNFIPRSRLTEPMTADVVILAENETDANNLLTEYVVTKWRYRAGGRDDITHKLTMIDPVQIPMVLSANAVVH